MSIILLKKLRLDKISCSGRSGARWHCGVPKSYEIMKRLGTPGLCKIQCVTYNAIREI